MKLARSGFAALAVMTFACNNDSEPGWVGVYTVHAAGVMLCEEHTTATGRTCDCAEEGHLEGTLTLTATAAGQPSGTISLAECYPFWTPTCNGPTPFAVVPHQTSNPNPPEGLSFCAGHCPFTGSDGGIQFSGAAFPANPLTGHFSRSDGNVRSCGADAGPFTLTRQ